MAKVLMADMGPDIPVIGMAGGMGGTADCATELIFTLKKMTP